MSKTTVERAREMGRKMDAVPIACRLPAEPGWRAVLLVPIEEGSDDLRILVIPIVFWGFTAPTLEEPDLDTVALLGSTAVTRLAHGGAGPFGAIFGGMSEPPPPLWPLDRDGKRMNAAELHRIVPPSAATNEEVLAEAQAWCVRLGASVERATVAEAKLKIPEGGSSP